MFVQAHPFLFDVLGGTISAKTLRQNQSSESGCGVIYFPQQAIRNGEGESKNANQLFSP
jgi:hypothetical protein